MKPDPTNPNELWAKHGFTIQRIPRRGRSGHHRIVRNAEGLVVLQDAGHERELKWIKLHLETA